MNNKYAALLMMKSKLFSGFSFEECAFLKKVLKPVEKTYKKRTIICQEGDRVNFIGIILRGRIIGEKFCCDGSKTHLVHTFGTKDVIGLETIFSSSRESPITYAAQEETNMLCFPCAFLAENENLSLVQRLKIMENISKILADENIKNMYKLEVLSKRALRSRILTFLSIMERKTGEKTFSIGMDREQFARYLCVNRSSLSYELGQMQKEGLIILNKDWFTLL